MTVTDTTTRQTANASHAASRADKTVLAAWRPTDTAPDDGAVILGRYDDTEREIRWARNRPGRMGAGWVAVEDGDYIDPPQCWRPVAPVEHLLSDACPCEPYIDGPSARLHRGNPTNIVFVPSPGDDVDAAGHALVDHR